MLLDVPLHVADVASLVDAGVGGAFAFEGPGDVFVPLARAAGAPIDLYSNIAVSFPRSPTHLAYTAWDLQRLSNGRFMLGLGSQVRAHVERRFGAAFDRPAARMADQVDAIRAAFRSWQDGERFEHHGEFWDLDLMPPLFNPGPLPHGPPPILVAAVGPQMTRVAARHADGILLHPFTSTRFVHEQTLPPLADVRAGFLIVGGAIVAVAGADEDQSVADEAARGLVAFYGSTPAYRPVLEAEGHGDIQPELRELTRQGRWAEMSALVDDTVLASIVLRGTPDEVASQVRTRYGDTVTRVAVTVPHPISTSTLADLAAAVSGL